MLGRKALGYQIAQWCSERVPMSRGFRVAEWLSDQQWRRSRRYRAAVQANLSMILGVTIVADDPRIREVFRNFGRYLVEFFTIHQVQHPDVQIEGYAHVVEAQREHRGTILLTAHVGNWEVGAVLVHRLGWPVTAVALPHEEASTNRLFQAQRRRCGIHVMTLDPHVTRQCLSSLRRGHLLGVLGDLDFMGNGITAPLGGQAHLFPRGPALLSLRSRAPVVPTFLIREGLWKFRLCFEPPILPERSGTPEDSIRTLTLAYAAVIERYLKRFPEQWLVFQPAANLN